MVMARSITIFCLLGLLVLFVSCTVYTEKQSEALSRSVYATKDSLDKARIDLADDYATQAVRIVKPPKTLIEINSVYKKTIDPIASQSKHSPIKVNRQRVVIIPERYKNDTVIVVSSEEYNQLLKDKEIFDQIAQDNKTLQKTKKLVDEELVRQKEFADKMVKDLNVMQKKLVEKDLAILQRNVVIIVLLLSIGGATYLRIKGIL